MENNKPGLNGREFTITLNKNWFCNTDLITAVYHKNKFLNFIYKLLKRKPMYYESGK